MSRRMVLVLSLLATLLAAAPRVTAQEQGQLELGLFGRFNVLENGLRPRNLPVLEDRPGVGARAGLFFLPHLAVEADAGFTRFDAANGRSIDIMPRHVRLLWEVPAWDQISLLLGAGYARTVYNLSLQDAWSDDGVGALLGCRFYRCGRLSFRLEGTYDLFQDPALGVGQGVAGNDKVNASNWGLQFGASLFFGRKTSCDTDGDGVVDKIDRCPDTPPSEPVDAAGCPLPQDSDGDGVFDSQDNCPDTPQGEEVDTAGCPLPKDSDGDGVLDPQDKCPHTLRGEPVDAAGCPLPKDSDGDGVLDPQDRCPSTPQGTPVDAGGCPRVFEEGKQELILEGVNFETGQATLLPESQAVLDKVAASLSNHPSLKVEVAGYTDSRGGRTMNLKLSQARADAVRDHLVGKGVAAGRLTAKGYGPDKPLADNATDTGRARNRRVELRRVE